MKYVAPTSVMDFSDNDGHCGVAPSETASWVANVAQQGFSTSMLDLTVNIYYVTIWNYNDRRTVPCWQCCSNRNDECVFFQ
ncbi:hypothetical protein C2845_PM03G18430 [Panicum miliaceum]|uniref:Uncharacterized protein n=1 Tax=Panicum miliaceum TaxID=4540 RepID=A0A3L6TEJ2_PANMI|nr:hypothetical protein C2845_PM03G18430 [Panicum miliaceum]